jgi:NADH-quinone oxidoreductase subunit L
MLVGCLAIAGAGFPFAMGWIGGDALTGLGLSGFYSKDAILEQAYSFWQHNPSAWSSVFFLAAAGGAAITAFYMFRMWYLTFAGQPRNRDRYEHAHESPPVMYMPLVILAVMAAAVAWTPYQAMVGGLLGVIVFGAAKLLRRPEPVVVAAGHGHDSHGHGSHGHSSHGHETHGHDAHGHDAHGHDAHSADATRVPVADIPLIASGLMLVVGFLTHLAYRAAGVADLTLAGLLESARPAGTAATMHAVWLSGWVWPAEHLSHEPSIVVRVTMMAMGTAFTGFLLATVMYGWRRLDAAEVRRQFQPIYRLLWNKWWFDELYDWLFVRPSLGIARMVAGFDRNWIDWLIDNVASMTKAFAFAWDYIADRSLVDGFVNRLAEWTYATGLTLRSVQTGRVRQYVMFIVIGAVAMFVLISLWNTSLAG